MNQASSPRSGFGSIVVRLAGLWILIPALAKLFLGTPKDLPAFVRDQSPFGLDVTFHVVIGIELTLVALAWIAPFLAWSPIVALFVFFDFVLVTQMRAGAKNCGCFGESIHVDPHVMLWVDSALLLALLLARPWRSTNRSVGRRLAPIGACTVLAFALPWIVIRNPGAGAAGSTAAPRWVEMQPDKWVNKSVFDVEDLTR